MRVAVQFKSSREVKQFQLNVACSLSSVAARGGHEVETSFQLCVSFPLRKLLFSQEQSCRAGRGREQDVAEISRRMYEEIRSSRDPRDHVEDG